MLPGNTQGAITFAQLQGYIAILLKHGRMVVLTICLALAAGLMYFMYAPPVYKARGAVEVVLPLVPTPEMGADYNALWSQLQSTPVLERAARSLGLDPDSANLKNELVRNVMIFFTPTGNIVIEAYPYSKELAPRWPKAVVDGYQQYRDELRIADRREKLRTYTARISEARERRREFEERRMAFIEGKQLVAAENDYKTLQSVPEELVAVNRVVAKFDRLREVLADDTLSDIEKLSVLSTMRQELRLAVGQLVTISAGSPVMMENGGKSGLPLPGTPDRSVVMMPNMLQDADVTAWEALDTRFHALKDQYDETGKRFLPTHPKMVELSKQLSEVKVGMQRLLQGVVEHYNLEYVSLTSRKQDLERKVPLFNAAKRRYEALSRQLSDIDAGQMAWDAEERSSMAALKRMDYDADRDYLKLRYSGFLSVSDSPVSPNRGRVLALALVLGVALSLLFMAFLELLDNTVSDPEDIRARLGLQPLGIIPRYFDAAESGGPDAEPAKAPPLNGVRLETFRVVRTNFLANRSISQARQIVMVTSALPREGKSMIAFNLARAFAQSGEKTLLIDGDARRGRQHRQFGIASTPGFSDLLLEGHHEAQDYCRQTDVDNLWLLPCGTRTSRFPELMSHQTMSTLMGGLRDHYERIILDTTPVLGLAETHCMLPYVDGVLLVIWSGYTPRKAVDEAVNQLTSNGGNFYGFVLNQIDLTVATNYHRYYYYSSYYYSSYRPDPAPRELPPVRTEA